MVVVEFELCIALSASHTQHYNVQQTRACTVTASQVPDVSSHTDQDIRVLTSIVVTNDQYQSMLEPQSHAHEFNKTMAR